MFVCLFPFFVFPPSLSGLRKYANLVHVREGRLKMSREGRRAAREMLRPATDTYLVMITRRRRRRRRRRGERTPDP